VGRSGTTALFEFLRAALLMRREALTYRYEPYLWSVGSKRPFDNNRSFASNSSLNPEGIYRHCSTPLFVHPNSAEHDPFIDQLLVPENGGNVLVKFIRASGRIPYILNGHRGAKVVHIMRNPISVVDSAMSRFSLLGEEFHVSDRFRLLDEFKSVFGRDPLFSAPCDMLEWQACWWSAMNEAAFEARQAADGRMMIVSQEALVHDAPRTCDSILAFLGISAGEVAHGERGSSGSGEPTAKPSAIGRERASRLQALQDLYFKSLLDHDESGVALDRDRIRSEIAARHDVDVEQMPLLEAIDPDKTIIEVRNWLYAKLPPSSLRPARKRPGIGTRRERAARILRDLRLLFMSH